jgi:Fe2+ or Zn2+ uptake regulation protein
MDTDRLSLILTTLGQEGRRITEGRRAVVEALVAAPGHVSADDLADSVRRSARGVHRATVYRTLEALEHAGLVEHVHLGHGRSVYHLVDDLHQHLVCEVCGAVEEAPDGLLNDVAARLRDERGFVMRPYHFAVLGRCARCAAGDPGRDGSVHGDVVEHGEVEAVPLPGPATAHEPNHVHDREHRRTRQRDRRP